MHNPDVRKGLRASTGRDTRPERWRRHVRVRLVVTLVCGVLACATIAGAQGPPRLLDRVVARVGAYAVTLTEVQAEVGLGVVSLPSGIRIADPAGLGAAVDAVINRRLVLDELMRFPPPEPDESAVDQAVARMRTFAGADLPQLLQATGVDDDLLRAIARNDLRIRAYIADRFGAVADASEEDARRYYDGHPDEFERDGGRLPFAQVSEAARARAGAARRDVAIAQWYRELRARAEVVTQASQVGP